MECKKILKSRKCAIVISYVLILVNTLSNLILTPLYLKYLGMEQYGLYQMIYSVAHYILILDFGISTTMVRYISNYHANNDYESEKKFAAHCLMIVLVIEIAVFAIGIVINNNLLNIYPSITIQEIGTASSIFIMMVATIMMTIINHYFEGIIMSYEHFVVVKGYSLLKITIKIALTIIMLLSGLGVIAIVFADLIVGILSVLFLGFYSFVILRFKVKFSKVEISLIISMLTFMFAIFLQSIVQYVNSVVDKTILGVMTTKTDVAVYSIALTFITLFNSLPSAITAVFLPQAVRLVNETEDGEKLTKFIIRPGRFQFMICGAIVAGFLLLGKQFILLWAGKESIQAWDVALIIMIPNMIPLMETAVQNILDAKNKRLFRSIVLLGISILNVLISIILVKKYGMMGAPIGTALAFIVGYGIIMNIYYAKKFGIRVMSMFGRIMSRTWICVCVAAGAVWLLNTILPKTSWILLAFKIVIFMIVYFVSLLLFGFNHEEKNDVMGVIRRVPGINKLIQNKTK